MLYVHCYPRHFEPNKMLKITLGLGFKAIIIIDGVFFSGE